MASTVVGSGFLVDGVELQRFGHDVEDLGVVEEGVDAGGAGAGGEDGDVFDGVDAGGGVVGEVAGLEFGAGVVFGVGYGVVGVRVDQ